MHIITCVDAHTVYILPLDETTGLYASICPHVCRIHTHNMHTHIHIYTTCIYANAYTHVHAHIIIFE